MDLKLVTAVATEPVSLSQLKLHLRLASLTFAGDITTYQSIVPGAHVIAGSYSLVGSAADVLNKRAIVNLDSGTNGAGGTVDVKIQESDDNITYADWAGGAFTQVTTVNDNAIQEIEYTGTKRYIRVVCTIAVATCDFGVSIIVDSGDTAEDTLLSNIITQVREYGEEHTGHAFAAQTWDYYLSDFPSEDYIEWPRGPLTAITGIYYKNSAGVETTMTVTTEYLCDFDTFPGKVFLPYNDSWPSFTPYPYNGVRIRGVCGYTGVAPYILPKNYYQAMLLHAGLMYKYRESDLIPEKALEPIKRLYDIKRARWF